MPDKLEKRNRRIGLITSISLHGLLAVLFFFMVAWKAPFPPAEQYGILLNFGLEDAGTGNIQPVNKQPENVSSGQEKPVEKQIETPENQVKAEPEQTNTVKPTTPEAVQQQESPVKTEEAKPDKNTVQPSTENKNSVTKPTTTNTQAQKNVNPQTTGAQGQENKNTSQGDQVNAKGDQGNPQGKIDARALYGTQGGGQGGSSLDMVGWEWDSAPKPHDTSNENGKIVFEIKINERGELISVRTLEKTVSPEVEKVYREAVEELTFSPLSSNVRPASVTTGKITFLIRSR